MAPSEYPAAEKTRARRQGARSLALPVYSRGRMARLDLRGGDDKPHHAGVKESDRISRSLDRAFEARLGLADDASKDSCLTLHRRACAAHPHAGGPGGGPPTHRVILETGSPRGSSIRKDMTTPDAETRRRQRSRPSGKSRDSDPARLSGKPSSNASNPVLLFRTQDLKDTTSTSDHGSLRNRERLPESYHR